MKRRVWPAVALAVVLGAGVLSLGPRKVSPQAIERSVIRTPALIERAWTLPVAATYRHRVSFQRNGSLCGPASLANAFRSLGEPAQNEAQVLAGSGLCWSGMCFLGLTLDQLAGVARLHTHRKVSVLRDLDALSFREQLRKSNDPARRTLVNFTRRAIFGAGGGHHSPIGGYLEAEDLVFVLDVNGAFQPWLIERSRLFAAVDTFDGDKKRGLLVIE